jgi:hypothetical protein
MEPAIARNTAAQIQPAIKNRRPPPFRAIVIPVKAIAMEMAMGKVQGLGGQSSDIGKGGATSARAVPASTRNVISPESNFGIFADLEWEGKCASRFSCCGANRPGQLFHLIHFDHQGMRIDPTGKLLESQLHVGRRNRSRKKPRLLWRLFKVQYDS